MHKTHNRFEVLTGSIALTAAVAGAGSLAVSSLVNAKDNMYKVATAPVEIFENPGEVYQVQDSHGVEGTATADKNGLVTGLNTAAQASILIAAASGGAYAVSRKSR